MTTTQLRTQGYQRILDYLNNLLPTDSYAGIIRSSMGDSTNTPEWMVSRSLLMLEKRLFLFKKRDGALGNIYRKGNDFGRATASDLYQWVKEYNEAANEKSRDKKAIDQSLSIPTTQKSIEAAQTLELAFSELKYGFFGVDGAKWFTTMEEASQHAVTAAIQSGVCVLHIVQKVGKVVNQPQVMLFE